VKQEINKKENKKLSKKENQKNKVVHTIFEHSEEQRNVI
jgi:hypothetical protein